MTNNTTAVLLAAGNGSRLGLGPKALLRFHGIYLVEHIANILLDGGCDEIIIVLGAGKQAILENTDLRNYRVITNPKWNLGMSSSFRLGLGAVKPNHNVLVCLVDQPGLTVPTIKRLLETHVVGKVTAAAYKDQDGILRCKHPVLFDASIIASVIASSFGDSGGRNFLRANAELINLIDCSDQSSGEDIDTIDQLYLLG